MQNMTIEVVIADRAWDENDEPELKNIFVNRVVISNIKGADKEAVTTVALEKTRQAIEKIYKLMEAK